MDTSVDYVRLARNGSSLNQIAEILNLFPSQASGLFIRKTGVRFLQHRTRGLVDHLMAVDNKQLQIYQVREAFNFTPITFYHKVLELGRLDVFYNEKPLTQEELKRLRDGLGEFAKPDIDSLIDFGSNLSEAALEGQDELSRQAVAYYVKGSGQFRYYLNKKRKLFGKREAYTQGASASS